MTTLRNEPTANPSRPQTTATAGAIVVRVLVPPVALPVVSGAQGRGAFRCASGGGRRGFPASRPLLAVVRGAGVEPAPRRGARRRRCRPAPTAAPAAHRRPPRGARR